MVYLLSPYNVYIWGGVVINIIHLSLHINNMQL
nr:MAG TPA: hypothetical protein [Caudoviricetes sp.]